MNFARKAKRVARRQHRHGLITDKEYAKVKEAVRDPKVVAKWQAEVERQMAPPWTVSAGFIDWGAVWDWLVKNWPKIQAILLKLLPLLILEPNPTKKKYRRDVK